MRFFSVNTDHFLIELEGLPETLALYAQLQQLSVTGIRELIPAAKTILVRFNELETSFKLLVTAISALKPDALMPSVGAEVIIPMVYDGEDLPHVAEQQGLSIPEVIAKHQRSLWQVAFIGFAPGFAYLRSPDQPFGDIPRLTVPRKKIKAGALGLAGQFSGIYPKDSPGGWQLIGHSLEKMWDLERNPPALLMPGMQVHFEDVTHRPTRISLPPSRVHRPTALAGQAALSITCASLQMLMQDEGRFDQSQMGVGVAGAMDLAAMHSANRLVGNPRGTAVLEILNGGFKAKVHCATVLAVTGANSPLKVKYADGHIADWKVYQSIALDAGDELQIATPNSGLRNYLALRGGLKVNTVLNSASYDSLAQLGPAPLKQGDILYQDTIKTTTIAVDEAPAWTLPKVGELVELDIVMGPRCDWFSSESLALLCQQHWLVSNDSNRVGLRLLGEQPLTRAIHTELESEGTCIGALQIPPSGQPVLFMHDHPLTGGYPVIAAVAKHHWDLVAQIPAGCQIKFNKIAECIAIGNES
jgi:KipI family sensor histidine kinase inhibitor